MPINNLVIMEKGELIYNRALGKCEVCGKVLSDLMQLAHIVPQNKVNIAKYGEEVIHHIDNLAAVCSLQCNSIVGVSTPVMEAKLMELIKGGFNTRIESDELRSRIVYYAINRAKARGVL